MEFVKANPVRYQTVRDLKPLLSASGPCLTVYLPFRPASNAGANPNAKQNDLHWRECLRTLTDGSDRLDSDSRTLIESVQDWSAVAPEKISPDTSLVVFRSAEIFQVAVVDGELPERAILSRHFYIRPLLAALGGAPSFYLLALSQNDTRLLHCTTHSSEEVPLPAETQTSFDKWMNQVKPDHTAVYNAVASGSPGSRGATALAPKGSDAESRDEYLSHFCKQVAHGVGQVLKESTNPLVLCAVEYEVPLYHKVNTYPHLLAEPVKGAPNSLKSGEMHARALAVLRNAEMAKVDTVLAEWDHRVGAGASSRLKEVVTAAHEGRVLHLVISDTQEKTGVFHEDRFEVQARQTGSAADEDLVNDAAVQVLLHGGNVLVAPNNKMPNGDAVAAVYRY